MKEICIFPSKIFVFCRRPFTRRDLLPLGLSMVMAGALLTLLLRLLLPFPAAAGLGLFGAIFSVRLLLRLILTRKQYQPVTMEIHASESSFCVTIPRLDLAGFPRRQQSCAPLNSVTAFEYSESLHCIHLCASYTTCLYDLPSNRLFSKPEVPSYFFYLSPEDETPVLSALESLFGRQAKRMDAES